MGGGEAGAGWCRVWGFIRFQEARSTNQTITLLCLPSSALNTPRSSPADPIALPHHLAPHQLTPYPPPPHLAPHQQPPPTHTPRSSPAASIPPHTHLFRWPASLCGQYAPLLPPLRSPRTHDTYDRHTGGGGATAQAPLYSCRHCHRGTRRWAAARVPPCTCSCCPLLRGPQQRFK